MEYNKNNFALVEKDYKRKANGSKRKSEISGVYGLFLESYKSNIYPDYIGYSSNIYLRCHRDHQKPSQPLIGRILGEVCEINFSHPNWRENFNIMGKHFYSKYEWRVIQECNSSDGYYFEKSFIKFFQPKFNRNNKL